MKIKTLKINNVRKFPQQTLEFKKDWTIIVAPNASGKSTIIESVHMLAHGRSPWTSTNSEIIRWKDEETNQNNYQKLISNNCRIEADILQNKEQINASLYLENNDRSTKKQFQINGKITTRNKFTSNIHSILFSPDLIDVLMFRPQERRSFLDDTISQFDLDYSEILTKYNKVLRQRNSLLKLICSARFKNKNTENLESTLKFWTKQLIILGSKIMAKRIQFIDQINQTHSQLYQSEIEYLPKVELSEFEEMAESNYIANLFKTQILESKNKDIMRGTTSVGPHRDDWFLKNKSRNINTYGSRGEKRMAIADIIFKLNSIIEENIQTKPIILLDDVASELDPKNIELLFSQKISKDQQVIITTTDIKSIPKSAIAESQIIEI